VDIKIKYLNQKDYSQLKRKLENSVGGSVTSWYNKSVQSGFNNEIHWVNEDGSCTIYRPKSRTRRHI